MKANAGSKRQKITPDVATAEPDSKESGRQSLQIVQCLTEGLPLNVAVRAHGSTFKTLIGGEECSIHPSSALFGKNLVTTDESSNMAAVAMAGPGNEMLITEQRVLFSELMRTSK